MFELNSYSELAVCSTHVRVNVEALQLCAVY